MGWGTRKLSTVPFSRLALDLFEFPSTDLHLSCLAGVGKDVILLGVSVLEEHFLPTLGLSKNAFRHRVGERIVEVSRHRDSRLQLKANIATKKTPFAVSPC